MPIIFKNARQMNLGRVFKTERERRGITQRGMARMLGLTPAALWKIENGHNWPKADTVKKFCLVTSTPVAFFYIQAIDIEDYQTPKQE